MAAEARRHRYLLITNWIGWAGAETQLEYLAIGLAREGHEVILVATGDVVADTRDLRRAGVEVVALGVRRRWEKLLVPLRMFRRARRAEVIHCTGWDATLWGRLAALLARRPMVITEHTPGREFQVASSGSSRVRAIALHNRLLDRFTYAVIVVGAWQRRLLESEGVRGESIVHIPNAVPVEALRAAAARAPERSTLGIPDDARVVIEVARFAPQKGQATALRTVAALRERFGDVRLLLVGDGETRAQVEAEAARLGADWAEFLGGREDVPELLALADVSILPSTAEGLPMTLIESVAVGTPIVATDVGDVGWLVETTGAGLCVPPDDESAFCDACARLLADSELRARLAAAGAAAAPRFDAPLMVERYRAVLEAAIDSAPLPELR
jgi:glycosyltransferase involved in cell wall biosynthesis